MTRISPSSLRAVGNAEAGTISHYACSQAASAIAETYGVGVELSLWGKVMSYTPEGERHTKETLTEGHVINATEVHGVRSADHLAQLISMGRMKQATDTFEAMRERVLNPLMSERVTSLALNSAVAALGAGRRVKAEVNGIKRVASSLFGGGKPPGP